MGAQLTTGSLAAIAKYPACNTHKCFSQWECSFHYKAALPFDKCLVTLWNPCSDTDRGWSHGTCCTEDPPFHLNICHIKHKFLKQHSRSVDEKIKEENHRPNHYWSEPFHSFKIYHLF